MIGLLPWLQRKLRRKGGGNVTETPQEDIQQELELSEGYPTTVEVLRMCSQSDRLPDSGIRRLEINCFADGSATARVWLLGAEEPEGAFLSAE